MGKKEELAKIVGKENVITDKEVLAGFENDLSFVSGKTPECVVKPRNMDDVQKIVKLANANGFSLIPCSSKGPRLRGDTVPASASAVMVDLSGMDSIVRVDKRNKVAMVQPGVTFGRLIEAAEKEELRVVMPLLPRKTKSVMGSCLEQEPVTIPKYHWDTTDPMCCMEVIFGTGDLLRTGEAGGPGTLQEQWAAGQAQKCPIGPAQSDLARIIQGSQGTMGIVTWATIKLELLPQAKKAFLVGAQSMDALFGFTYATLQPKLTDECLIVNSMDLACICGKNSKEIQKLAKDMPPWILIYSIGGYEYFPEERVDYLEKDIADIAKQYKVRPVQNIAGLSAEKIVGIIGRPSEEPYWKFRSSGACQDIFFLTTLDRTPKFITAMEAEAEKCKYPTKDLGIYIQPTQQGRTCHLEFNLMYDPKNSEETKRVKDLFDSASKTLLDMGGFFSRPYGPWADMAYKKCPGTVKALGKIKGIFDPKGVMNPGKLCFGKGEL